MSKIGLFEKFLDKLFKVYKDRVTLFKTYYQKNILEKIKEEEYQNWLVLFAPQNKGEQERRSSNDYLDGYDPDIVDWKEMNYLLTQRMKMNDSKTR